MKEKETKEEKVINKYIELGGLVKDGQMVNKEKEDRARKWVTEREKFIDQILKQERITQNSKYGEFIIQTNEVQYYLIALIKVRTLSEDKDFLSTLERAPFGQLIGYFTLLASSESEFDILRSLKKYKDFRHALAHKMFTDKKLTPEDCKEALKLGETIIDFFTGSIRKPFSPLTEPQILSILALLASFGAEHTIIKGAEDALRGRNLKK